MAWVSAKLMLDSTWNQLVHCTPILCSKAISHMLNAAELCDWHTSHQRWFSIIWYDHDILMYMIPSYEIAQNLQKTLGFNLMRPSLIWCSRELGINLQQNDTTFLYKQCTPVSTRGSSLVIEKLLGKEKNRIEKLAIQQVHVGWITHQGSFSRQPYFIQPALQQWTVSMAV